jgi:hypothetical protein
MFSGSAGYGSSAASVTGADKPTAAPGWQWWFRVATWRPR